MPIDPRHLAPVVVHAPIAARPVGPIHHGPVLPVHPVSPVSHPVPVTPGAPVHVTHGAEPPEAHRRHGDYVFVEGYDWYPSWFPYYDAQWFAYWAWLYDYYGGDGNAAYAEYARDWALRQIAITQGWL